jgi:hypothetical protein
VHRPLAGLPASLVALLALAVAPVPAHAADPDPPSCTTPAPFEITLPEPDSTIGSLIPMSGVCTGTWDTLRVDVPPSHGTLDEPDGSWAEYHPDSGYRGPDSFSYHVEGPGGASNVVTYELSVPDAPPDCILISDADNFIVAQGDTHALWWSCFDDNGDPITYTLAQAPDHGVLEGLEAGDTIPDLPNARYRAPLDYTGFDYAWIRADDGQGGVTFTAFTFFVVEGPNRPPVCPALGPLAVTHDAPREVHLACADADPGDTLTYNAASGPTHGRLTGSGARLTYTPDAGYAGPDSFTYRARDGSAKSPPATVSLTVAAAAPPDAPGPPTDPDPAPHQPSRAALRSALGADLRSLGRALHRMPTARIAHHGVRMRLHWLEAGQTTVSLRTRVGGTMRVLARGTARRTSAGTKRIRLAVTGRGRRVLAHRRTLRVAVIAAFHATTGTSVAGRRRASLIRHPHHRS